MPRIVIVGGGISGLSIAYRLQQTMPGADITVLERSTRAGGSVWTERSEGFQVEVGPNGFLDTKTSTLSLCRELDIGDQLTAANKSAAQNRYLFLDGRLRPLPGGLRAFLRSDLLSWRGKLDFLAERFRPSRRSQGDESIAAFARRRAGAEAAEVLADGLVTGIYAGDPALLSARACFPRLATLEEQYGSILKGLSRSAARRRAEAAPGEIHQRPGQMWSLRPGLRQLIDSLCARLKRPPLLGVGARRIDKVESWIVRGEGQECWQADVVVLACPAYQQAALLADLDEELAREVGAIPYNRVAVVALGYRQADVPISLNGFGYIAPQRTRRDVLGVQWCSSLFADRAPAGPVLLRALCGGWHRPEVAGWDDDRLLDAMQAELRLAMGVTAAPIMHHIVRWDRAIPQYHLGHLERVAWIEQRATRYSGLFLAGNAYHGVALNDCTEQGEALARRISQFIGPA